MPRHLANHRLKLPGGKTFGVLGRPPVAGRPALVSTGHFHVSHSDDSGDRYALAGYEALVVSAGTATSTRGRGESNSFNVLRLASNRIEVERREWQPADRRFTAVTHDVFERQGRRWQVTKG